jgi:hypothetical protein
MQPINVYYAADKTIRTMFKIPVYSKKNSFDATVLGTADHKRKSTSTSGQGYKKKKSRKWENSAIIQTSIGPGITIKDERSFTTG